MFGEYIDIYDLTRAVEDGATVKVSTRPGWRRCACPRTRSADIDDAFADAISGSEEDEAQERLKSRWARVEAIVGAEERLDEMARDIVGALGEAREVMPGKAMIVTMSRRIAVDLYTAIVALRPDWHSDDDRPGGSRSS